MLAFLSLLASSRGDVVGVQSESLNVGKALQSRTFNSLKRAIHFLKLVRSYTTSGTLVAQPSSKATASKYTIPPFGGEKVIRSLGSAFSRELNLVCPFFTIDNAAEDFCVFTFRRPFMSSCLRLFVECMSSRYYRGGRRSQTLRQACCNMQPASSSFSLFFLRRHSPPSRC